MSAADIAALRQMAREFTEGFNGGDVDRLMRFYGDRYVDVNLRRPVQTYEERRAYFTKVMGAGGFHIQVHPEEILVEGDMALVRGRIELSGARTGELRYLEVARRTAEGWKAVWGMDGPVQENEPL